MALCARNGQDLRCLRQGEGAEVIASSRLNPQPLGATGPGGAESAGSPPASILRLKGGKGEGADVLAPPICPQRVDCASLGRDRLGAERLPPRREDAKPRRCHSQRLWRPAPPQTMKGAARHGRFPHPGALPEGEGEMERAARDLHRKEFRIPLRALAPWRELFFEPDYQEDSAAPGATWAPSCCFAVGNCATNALRADLWASSCIAAGWACSNQKQKAA